MKRIQSPWIGTKGRFYVYIHSKPDGTPFYIGKGTMYRAFRVKHSRNALHGRIVAEYGAENIRVSIIECDSNEEAGAVEKRLIAEYRQTHELANRSTGGQGAYGYQHTPEQRKRSADARRGLRRSPEAIEASAAANRGRGNTVETCLKIAASWTPERKAALSVAMSGGKCPSKRPGVAAKISAATKDKPKPNLKGLRTGWKTVHTHSQTRFVPPDEVEALLLQGWKRGLGPRHRRWIDEEDAA